MTDERFEPRVVALVEGNQPATGGDNRQPRQWNWPEGRMLTRPRVTLADALSGPCRWYSEPGRPAGHSTTQCSWTG